MSVEDAVIRIDDVTAKVHMEEMIMQGEKMLANRPKGDYGDTLLVR